MRNKVIVVLAGTLAIFSVRAGAQDKKVVGSIGFGFTAPNAEVRDHLGNGYNFNLGVQFNVTPAIGIEGLYSFNGLGSKTISVPVFPAPNPDGGVPTNLSADMNMQFGTVNLVAQKPSGSARPYGLVGMGVYYRPVKVTSPGVGFVPGYCDPWWYICYPGGWVEVTNILGKRSSTDFGMDFGGGVTFGTVYAELRYHYIWGPTVPDLASAQPIPGNVFPGTRKANGQFLVTTFGVRF